MSRHGDLAVMIACGLSLLAAMSFARAESLPDPTRPPASAERGADDGSAPATAAPSGLQTIIRRSDGKPAALINGEYVMVGGRVGEARVVRIGEDSVTLKSAAGEETLKLIPGIEKVPSVADGKAVAKKKAATTNKRNAEVRP